jgi:uncharacterized OB-fold protein
MSLDAHRCPNGHITYPGHTVCPHCGERQTTTIDLSDRTAEVLTWTTSTATPTGVREPNTLAIVQFEVAGDHVRALGQVTADDEVAIGDEVEPVYVEQLREPGVGIKLEDADQAWDGYRFRPL